MAHYIVIYSKYAIVLFQMLFLVCSIYALRYERAEKQRMTANLQSVFLFLMQFSAYLTIVIRTRSMQYLILYAFLQILTLAVPVFAVLLYPGFNRVMLNLTCMLFSSGMIILTRLDFSKAVKQLVIAAVSFLLAGAVPFFMLKIKCLRKFGFLYGIVGIAALSAVMILGQVTNGSRLFWTIAGFSFQPSEFVKILYVLFLASLLDRETGWKQIIISGIGAALHVLILAASRDLGTALIFFAVYVIMISIASHKSWFLLFGTAAGGIASMIAYRLFSHVQVRVQAWKDPWSVIDNQGYQITQSLFAMSRGGLFGLGIGKGTPNEIPFVETDFIFAAVAEEMGLLFGIGILLGAFVLFFLAIRLASGLKDGFYRNLTVGFGFLYIFQTFLTVGGGIKFIPLTGVTLPFISYGGSSLFSTILLFALIQGIYVMRYHEELKFEKQRRKRAVESMESKKEGAAEA